MPAFNSRQETEPNNNVKLQIILYKIIKIYLDEAGLKTADTLLQPALSVISLIFESSKSLFVCIIEIFTKVLSYLTKIYFDMI